MKNTKEKKQLGKCYIVIYQKNPNFFFPGTEMNKLQIIII